MRSIFVVIGIVLSSAGFSQAKWDVELAYSIDHLDGGSQIGNQSQAGFNIQYTEFNYSVGLNFRREISKNLSALTGLSYAKKEVSRSFICPSCSVVAGDVFPS